MPKQGAIVLIPFPFTDLTEAKVRPVVVISSFKKSSGIIVAFISSQKDRVSEFDISVTPTTDNGLKTPSKIRCNKLATLDTKILIGEIGVLSKTDLAKVKSVLKKLFQ